MSNKINDNKTILWTIGFVVVVFTACLMFFQNQREKETAQAVENNAAETQPMADNVATEQRVESVALASLSSLAPQSMEEVEEPEEDSVEAQNEAKRLANWKANFPYKPTTDPDVVIPEGGKARFPIRRNHGYMRHFFENETRFTAQFEQLYRILEEHGRADNPMATANIFEDLRLYQKTDKKHQMDETGCTTT